MSHERSDWQTLSPSFHRPASVRPVFLEHARKLLKVCDATSSDARLVLQDLVESFEESSPSWPAKDRQILIAAGRVLTDLVEQGWSLRVRSGVVSVRPPAEIQADPLAEKERIRQQELVKRDEQLRQPAVQEFTRGMEKRRLYNGRFVSIFSLVRDGRDLARALREARRACTNGSLEPFDSVIDPYIQFISTGERCALTGLSLQDIWRYFRHTWSNQYTSVPGRTMLFLVRDRAADLHPVIGICALSSPIVQIRERDEWIGWHPSKFIADIRAKPSVKYAKWLVQIVDQALAELYVDDLLAKDVITRRELRSPTAETISRLVKDSADQRTHHNRYARSQDHKREWAEGSSDEEHWEARARTHLFRSKRALALAVLMKARILFTRHLGRGDQAKGLATLLEDSEGVHVVRTLLRKAKGDRVGIAMADISVCGAVAPYSAILGGKLVSMLATSPEVVRAYGDRYRAAKSEIASSMAGRPIVRPSHLVFLGTTSLYGVGSSQYNRIQIPSEVLGQKPGRSIQYQQLGRSESFGTSQFSEETVDALVALVQQTTDGQRVNSIFGEGVSPKLRKVREGLDLLGFQAEALLRHGRRRIVYGITLIENTREFLIGLDRSPKYLIPPKDGATASRRIATYWKGRWLKRRVESEEVLAAVERHTLAYPISHGARVKRLLDDRQDVFPQPS
jgi:hypothetical protein